MESGNADAVWAHFSEGGALDADVVSRSEAEELSLRVAELENEVSARYSRDPHFIYDRSPVSPGDTRFPPPPNAG